MATRKKGPRAVAKSPRRHSAPLRKAAATRPDPSFNALPEDLCAIEVVEDAYGALEQVHTLDSTLLLATDHRGDAKWLAASAVCHLAEGLRYFSNAVHAFLSHSKGTALHQAYYGELRAVFALYASSGLSMSYELGHTYLNNRGRVCSPSWRKQPTHKLAWAIWKEWVKTDFADTLFFDRLSIHPSVTLRALSDAMGPVGAEVALRKWGMDLLALSNDHNARNKASYDPYLTREPLTAMSVDDFSFVTELWQCLQPTAIGLQFERSLAHFLIDAHVTQSAGADPAFSRDAWYEAVCARLEASTGANSLELRGLLESRPYTLRAFDCAMSDDHAVYNVLSRCMFLLRLAMVAVDGGIRARPASPAKRWLINWLVAGGILGGEALPPADSWGDFEDLTALECPPPPLPHHSLFDPVAAGNCYRMCRPDAAVAWGLSI